MTYIEKFDYLKKTYGKKPDLSKLTEDFAAQITMTDEDCHGIFYVAYFNGVLAVEPYDYRDNTVAINVNSVLLEDILKGKADAVAAYNEGKLQAYGNLGNALKKEPAKRKPAARKAAAPKAEKPAKKAAEKAEKAVKEVKEEVKAKAAPKAKKAAEKVEKTAEKAVEAVKEVKKETASKAKKTAAKAEKAVKEVKEEVKAAPKAKKTTKK